MISTNTPLFAKSISVPKDMNQLSVEAFTAGIIEAALDGMGFVSRISRCCDVAKEDNKSHTMPHSHFTACTSNCAQCALGRISIEDDDPGQAEQGGHGQGRGTGTCLRESATGKRGSRAGGIERFRYTVLYCKMRAAYDSCEPP